MPFAASGHHCNQITADRVAASEVTARRIRKHSSKHQSYGSGPHELQPGVTFPGIMSVAVAAALALSPLQMVQPAAAADTVKVGSCLLQKCQLQLAECLGDPKCLQNIVCLNLCNTAKTSEEEAGCQIRCGDLYGDSAVDTFNACAVSEKKCVPQRADEGMYPIPPDCALDTSFDLSNFQGRWFITAGQNRLFDIFDCQEHFFAVPEPGRLAAKINWRINKPDGDFIERTTLQMFNQVPQQPALLLNHDNEYLHYQDDWYIIASKPDTYVVVYYKGSNDAWDGYGGAVVYTKARQLPEELVPELTAAVEKVGLKWSDFTITDNSCKPHPPQKSLIQEIESEAEVLEKGLENRARVLEQGIEKEAGIVEKGLETSLESGLRSFGKGFTVLEKDLASLEARFERELTAEERSVAKMLSKVEQQIAAEEEVLQGELFDELRGIKAAASKLLNPFTWFS
eukprot:gene13067-13194_t